ncbi:metallophosphoesterase [Chryseolinea sp. H1M3-3]|uniref:metallophosphoesterase n=1 Tax=Chryseolinea sp. H1M3-3 TaxID=3034144 RepID=UPI0023ECB12D|nr:metallophosphoesterase [Chryseolinea sp. H1M3-3]
MITLVILTLFFLIVDYYVFQAVLTVSQNWSTPWKYLFRYGFWVPTLISIVVLLGWFVGDPYKWSATVKTWVITYLFAIYFSKLFAVIVLFAEDMSRGVRQVIAYFTKYSDAPVSGAETITRSEFLSKTALAAAAIPFGTMVYGIISGAHDYRVRRETVRLPNLPKAFDGLKIAQLSDIHSGSFFNKTAVKGGVEMALAEKPDVIFFTGDLVNNEASEVKDYIDVFNKLKAPMGIYSVTGNHDYGDYHRWPNLKVKQQNFRDLIEAHRLLGFNLLMNENHFLELGGEKIAVIGIENWGGRGFAKYGKLDEAYRGTEEAATKLLLSHDPSHWDAQVIRGYNDIDLTFSGHTHGFQFGVEIGNFKWSPSQYAYEQWAGLYQKGSQYLYVNRGFGYLGYPGRIGMPPEITILELKRA